ncbi:hypothetical protein [Cupriavidus oxalaticus]|uniref:Uncharacterized protein n=1 Tax=Cupriavidus oxalaticus TaxID=96344 RepID=A0A5P3VFZ9_9BURK|nr:hypothetical protein [Cupriavidus oxalaticus]QEZ44151.1 hypothetical protein D2917_07850 [Cupriavidus oxalaticus]
MPIWSVMGVEEQPDITLQRWRVYETERGQHHFVGYCIENRSGRVSSAIVSYDANAKAGITRSGRRYVLSGNPGFDEDALHVWSFWSQRFRVKEAKDVSEEYFKQSRERASSSHARRKE